MDFQQGQCTGSKDLSARYFTTWDSDNFYIAVEVQDDVHLQQFESNAVYQNDGLQVFYDMDNNGTPQDPNLEDDYAWSFSLTEKGPQAYKAYVPAWQTAFLKEGLTADVELQINRNDDTGLTTYEMRIPKTNLRPLNLKEETVFGMALMINDADEDQRETGLMNTNGSEPWKNPGTYSDMILLK